MYVHNLRVIMKQIHMSVPPGKHDWFLPDHVSTCHHQEWPILTFVTVIPLFLMYMPPMYVSLSSTLLSFVLSQTVGKWTHTTYILLWFASFAQYMSMKSMQEDECHCRLLIFSTMPNFIVWIFFDWHFFCLTFGLLYVFSLLRTIPLETLYFFVPEYFQWCVFFL